MKIERRPMPDWINRAKKMETKLRRLEQMLEEVRNGGRYMQMEWRGGR